MNQANMLVPMLPVVALTVIALLRMAAARARAAKDPATDPAFYRAHLGTPEPEYAVVAARHYGNLLEAPLLFYVGCITCFLLAAASTWSLVWAWGFVAARCVQSLIHLTHNRPGQRAIAFLVGWLFLIALWIDLGWTLLAKTL